MCCTALLLRLQEFCENAGLTQNIFQVPFDKLCLWLPFQVVLVVEIARNLSQNRISDSDLKFGLWSESGCPTHRSVVWELSTIRPVSFHQEGRSEMDPIVLIGSENSYYTGKAVAYLRWKGISFRQVSATAEVYMKVILPRLGFAMVPIVIDSHGNHIQDTAVIIDHFENLYPSINPVIPKSPKQQLVSAIFELFGDEWLKIAAMYYRWAPKEQLLFLENEWDRMGNPKVHAFGTPEERASSLEAARKMMNKFAGFLPVLGVSKETVPGIESSYREFLMSLNNHLMAHRFLLSDTQPCVGDFGLHGPLFAHLYRDPVPGFMMKTEFPIVAEYVERLYRAAVPGIEEPFSIQEEEQTIRFPPASRSFLTPDEIPETLLPLLRMFFREHMPILLTTLRTFKEFVANLSPEEARRELPRGLNLSPFQIGGCQGRRMSFTFDVWKLQRVADVAKTSECKEFLSQFGGMGEALASLDNADVRVIKNRGKNKMSTLFLESHFKPSASSLL